MKPLFEEYKTFKQKQIRHFGFNATASSTMFGKKNLIGNVNVNIYKGFFFRKWTTPLNSANSANPIQYINVWRHWKGQKDQDGGPAESHWRHHGTPHWLLHHQWSWDHLLSRQVVCSLNISPKTGFVQSTWSEKLLSRLVASFRITQSDVKSAVKAKFESHLM